MEGGQLHGAFWKKSSFAECVLTEINFCW